MDFVNTFIGGVNRDISKSKYPNDKVYYLENFDIVTQDGLSTAALENSKGNLRKFVCGIGSDNFTIIGSGLIRNEVIIFGVIEGDLSIPDADIILRFIDDGTTNLQTAEVIWWSNNTTDRLGFSKNYRIMDFIPRYENQDLRKGYWTDNNNILRYLNVQRLIDDWNGTGPSTISATLFDIVPDVDFDIVKLHSLGTGGSYQAGMVQYCYRLYVLNGAETKISPLSGMIHITNKSETLSTTREGVSTSAATTYYAGAVPGTSCSKSVRVQIGTIDPDYVRIQLIAVVYSDISSVPVINIVHEGYVSGSFDYTDSGGMILGTITPEEFSLLGVEPFTCKSLASKENYLFPFNILERSFDIDYDARSYRFKINSSGLNPSDSYVILDFADTVHWGISETADCINPFNDITQDVNYSASAGEAYRYKRSSWELGGDGPNVSYKFTVSPYNATYINIDNNDDGWMLKTNRSSGVPFNPIVFNGGNYNNNSYEDYGSPQIHSLLVGYQHDEIYPFGIVFINGKGQRSFVKWIGDIRFPCISDLGGGWDKMVSSGGEIYARLMGIIFTVNNIPTDPLTGQVYKYQIVRCKRTDNDRTILGQGIMGKFAERTGSPFGNNHPTLQSTLRTIDNYHQAGLPAAGTDNRYGCKDAIWFSCPEISFFRNINHESGDWLQVVAQYAATIGSGETTYFGINAYDHIWKFREMYGVLQPFDIRHQEVLLSASYMNPGSTLAMGTYTLHNLANFGAGEPWGLTRVANGGTILACKLNGTQYDPNLFNDYTGSNLVIGDRYYVLNYKRARSNQYGGNTYSARTFRRYMTCSEILSGSGDKYIFGGDTFIGYFDFAYRMRAQDYADNFQGIAYYPVESSINLIMRHDSLCYSRDPSSYIQEEAGVYVISGVTVTRASDLYLYNTVYSRENDSVYFFPEPLDYPGELRNDVMVRRSEQKFNGEQIDNWTKFYINNYKELDTAFGAGTKIINAKDKLFTLQDKAVALLSVNVRSLITDQNGQELAVGTGGILDRYDYLTTNYGTKHHGSVVASDSGLYWYDILNQELCRFTDTLELLSTNKGISSYISKISSGNILNYDNALVNGGVISLHDRSGSKVLFTFKDKISDLNSFTIGFNELTNEFCGWWSFKPDLYILGEKDFYSTEQSLYPEEGWIHGKGIRGSWYEPAVVPTYNTSKAILLVNPGQGKICIFNNLEFISEMFTSLGVDIYNEGISYVRVWNDYQDSGVVNLTPDMNLRRRMRTWRLDIPRDVATYSPRMRNNFVFIELGFVNNADKRFVLNDIITKFVPSQL